MQDQNELVDELIESTKKVNSAYVRFVDEFQKQQIILMKLKAVRRREK